jgi:alpha-beta hydrolase superfamily lysophospholipase
MRVRAGSGQLGVLLIAATCTLAPVSDARAQARETVTIRGQAQSLRLYGTRGGVPVVVSSGDGGWIHLGPRVAEFLASKGFFVVGFDVRAYLESFTSGNASLRLEDEPGDYKVIADFAARGASGKPILIGVSEGAGLSVLAAGDPRTKTVIAGVIGLGLPDLNELGWRWKDSVVYLTHRVPDEPTFSVAEIVGRMRPIPLGAIHSTHDEFVPLPHIQRVMERASEPKKLWVIKAADHRFSDNLAELDQCLLEAITWVRQHSAR